MKIEQIEKPKVKKYGFMCKGKVNDLFRLSKSCKKMFNKNEILIRDKWMHYCYRTAAYSSIRVYFDDQNDADAFILISKLLQ